MILFAKILFVLMTGPFLPFFGDTEKIVENGNFEQVNMLGLPVGWNYRADSADWIKIKKDDGGNYLELNVPVPKTIYMIQYLEEFKPGKNYLVHWKAKGNSENKYRIYIEWSNNSKHGKPDFLKSSGLSETLKTDWTAAEYKCAPPGNGYANPYVVIYVKGPGRFNFTDIEIIETE